MLSTLTDLYASEDEEDEPTEGAETKEIESKDEGDGKLPDEGSEEGYDLESDDYEEVIEPEKSGDVEPKISVDDSINYSETEASGKDEL